MPVSVPVKPARNDGTPGSSPPGARVPRRSLASKQGIIIVRIRVSEYPGTEDSEDPACRNLGSILQRSSRRARAVPGVSVTQRDNLPPAPRVGSLAGDPLFRSSPTCPGLFTFARGTDRSPSAIRLAHFCVWLPAHRAFFHQQRPPHHTYAHAYTVAGRISGLDTNATVQVFDWNRGRSGKNLKLEATVAAETALSCVFFNHPIRPQCPWPGSCEPFLRQLRQRIFPFEACTRQLTGHSSFIKKSKTKLARGC